MNDFLKNNEFLITGGCGSLGKTLTKILQLEHKPRGIRLYSRDEYKQWMFKNELKNLGLDENVSFIIGDIRDLRSLTLAMKGVDIVFNCAAQKQIPACEENPFQAIQTNVVGAQNIVYAAIKTEPSRVININTDKNCHPENLYGATKMCAEKLFIHANVYTGNRLPHFACCRYGNVFGSRGSIIPLFQKQIEENLPLTITNEKMTRFWITLTDVVHFLLDIVTKMKGGNVYIPKMPATQITEIINTLYPNKSLKIIGIRKGEKLHETLITAAESLYTKIHATYYEIGSEKVNNIPWTLTSENCEWKLEKEKIKEMFDEIKNE